MIGANTGGGIEHGTVLVADKIRSADAGEHHTLVGAVGAERLEDAFFGLRNQNFGSVGGHDFARADLDVGGFAHGDSGCRKRCVTERCEPHGRKPGAKTPE